MDILLIVTLLVAAFYVGWNIGANDAANCIGTTVGAQIVSNRTAALLMSVFVILGGRLQGHHIMKTVGKGIIITDAAVYEEHNAAPAPDEFRDFFPDDRLPDLAILVALLSGGFFVTFATFTSTPVSTSQAIVGGVASVGIGIVGAQASFFKLSEPATLLDFQEVSATHPKRAESGQRQLLISKPALSTYADVSEFGKWLRRES